MSEQLAILLIGVAGAIVSPIVTALGLFWQYRKDIQKTQDEKAKLVAEAKKTEAEAKRVEAEARSLDFKTMWIP